MASTLPSNESSADRRSPWREDGRQPAGVDEHDVVAGASDRRRRCRAGRRSPCRCTCGRAPSRRARPPSGSPRPRRRSARRSRRRSSGRRSSTSAGRSPTCGDTGELERLGGERRDVGQSEHDALGDADRQHLGDGSTPPPASSARPATSPAWVPPLDDVCTIAAGVDPDARALLDQLDEAPQVAERARRRCCRRSGSSTAPHRRRPARR